METQRRDDLAEMPHAAPGLEVRAAGSEQLVHDPATGHVHVLNATAGRVLALCDGATPLNAIVDDLVAATEIDRARIARDVLSVCADFRRIGLLR